MIMDLALVIGIMIAVGFLGGWLAHRLKFPMITGYIIAGIILSPSLLDIVSGAAIEGLEIFTHLALGIIAYSIGGSLHWESIRRQENSILAIGTFQSIGAWVLSTLALAFIAPLFLEIPAATFANTYLPIALVIGAIASATAPAAILALVREYKAKGPLTDTLLSIVAYDDAIAIVLFSIALGLAKPMAIGGDYSLYQALFSPLLKILGSIAVGAVLGLALIYVARLVSWRSLLLVVVLGAVISGVGLTRLWGMSEILANMTIGFMVVNWAGRDEMLAVIDDIEDVIFTMFFVLAGLHFNLEVMRTASLLALLITGARFAGKYLGTLTGGSIARAHEPVKKYLGFALMPKAGVTIGLGLLAQSVFPAFGDLIYNGILASVIINEIIAPPMAKYAIFKAGEQGTG